MDSWERRAGGRYARFQRRRLGWTVQRLADELNVTKVAIVHLENGKSSIGLIVLALLVMGKPIPAKLLYILLHGDAKRRRCSRTTTLRQISSPAIVRSSVADINEEQSRFHSPPVNEKR